MVLLPPNAIMTLVAITAQCLGITDVLASPFVRLMTSFVDARLGMAVGLGEI
jgi:hypothetical protein